MSLLRECDRCKHRSPIESLNERAFRNVRIERFSTASSAGSPSRFTQNHELCRDCLIKLHDWLKRPAAEAVG